MKKILGLSGDLPEQAIHSSIEKARSEKQNVILCKYSEMEAILIKTMSKAFESGLTPV